MILNHGGDVDVTLRIHNAYRISRFGAGCGASFVIWSMVAAFQVTPQVYPFTLNVTVGLLLGYAKL